MNWIAIILSILIIYLLYYLFSIYFSNKTTITKQTYLGDGVSAVALNKMPNSNASKYSLELWVYVQTINAANNPDQRSIGPRNPKGNIFYIGDSKNQYISLDLFKDASAQLTFGSNQKNNADQGSNGIPVSITDSFPIQRWEYIVINVDNTFVEIYLDGKLIRSLKLPMSPSPPSIAASVYFGRGDMYIAQFQRNLYIIDHELAQNTYLKGNSGSLLASVTNYGVSFDLMKNNLPEYNYKLF